jgi:hypothetical protein
MPDFSSHATSVRVHNSLARRGRKTGIGDWGLGAGADKEKEDAFSGSLSRLGEGQGEGDLLLL